MEKFLKNREFVKTIKHNGKRYRLRAVFDKELDYKEQAILDLEDSIFNFMPVEQQPLQNE